LDSGLAGRVTVTTVAAVSRDRLTIAGWVTSTDVGTAMIGLFPNFFITAVNWSLGIAQGVQGMASLLRQALGNLDGAELSGIPRAQNSPLLTQ
jgi:hypothetical protein